MWSSTFSIEKLWFEAELSPEWNISVIYPIFKNDNVKEC